ncbi:hypothetical protein DSCOOX_33290 [Desulfosarcina ovata subsp. ovata]|uniref:Uncharacterized protein n=2 Tax=Desulfosarcina ovata TaxID=83564 RepID=A0A5K8ACC7_9BACT|nr:hypothetical protein DSCOOX_33290 [Desulfosarcina ovata subsp. ovata]
MDVRRLNRFAACYRCFRTKRSCLGKIILAGSLSAILCVHGLSADAAQDKRVERDTDNDGKIDQVALLDPRGNPVRLEIDSNADGRFDKIQHYRDGKLTAIESDRDHNGSMDTRDTFEDGEDQLKCP